MLKISLYTLDVVTPTSGLRLSVGCKGTWGQNSVFGSETYFHKWGRVQEIELNDSQVHFHFESCIHVIVLNI
jgi:hypothetical protein